MESIRSKDRAVIEAFAEFDPAKSAGFPPSVPLTIRCVSVFAASDSQTLVYIGTGGGKIILVLLNPSSTLSSAPNPATVNGNGKDSPGSGVDSTEAVEFLKAVSVSNRLIESIHVLSEIGKVLVLSDGFLFLLDLFLAQPVRKLGFIKDVTAVSKRIPCPESSSSDPLGDGVPKGEILRTGQKFFQKLGGGIRANGIGSRISEPHRGGANSCIIAVAAGKRLVLIEFFLPGSGDVDSDSGGVSVLQKEILGIDGVRTMAWLGDSIIVGTSDGYILFSTSAGKSTPIFMLPDSSGPPRLKSLWRSKEVLLLVDNVGVVVDRLGQPVGGSLIFQYIPESIAEMSSYVIVARDGRVDLYRKKTGANVQSLSFAKDGVGSCIVAIDDRGSGEVVVVATPYKALCFCKVSPEEQIKNLLRKKNYKEAICLMEEFESEGEMTKEMLSFVHAQVGFLLLFDLHFEDAVNHFLLSETMQPSEIFPFIMQDPNRWSQLVPRNRYWGLHPPPMPLEQVIDDGLVAIQRSMFLRKAGVDTVADEDFLLNPPSRAELLESAIKNIIRYLCISRDKDLILPVKEGVDTLLMYLYRALNLVGDMEKLASSQNSCVVEELESLLDDSGHLRTLAFLYASKGMCSKALTIWRILARNYSTGLWKDPAASAECDSLDISTDSISGQKSAASEAAKLLQESSDQDLVLEHLGWIADIDQEFAVMVLTSEKRVNQLSPEKVLAAVDPKKVEIQQRYLQWLIEDQDSDDTQFHTLYAVSLARSALEIVELDYSSEVNDARNHQEVILVSDVENANHCRYPVRERLQLFLQASDLYDPEEVLDVIEGSELWLEKAILYRKMGQETMVLQILALKLEDCEAAEQYCAEIGRNDAYMQLLDMYLDPLDGKEPMFKAAVRLLHNHGESLDPLQVLEKLSPEMPLQLAADIILRMLRARVHHHRQGQIVHNLSRAIRLDAQLARLEERSRHVQINDESICDSCHARLGTKLFAMYPDDSVVCYKCYRRQGESTSARGRNFKQDTVFKAGWLVSR
ncbi:vacuolar sorting protein 3 isoform X1 [Elaeis guineensis]|uniref:Vacuolar sorting protein 3 n=1 Tax=Elaeis guineensis var. tenera TaxID=51953 RepID=A0A6I9RPK9_ELAGV|nr:vacuolar sorting protein 3 [Elaeis guineensis]